jgi:WD40 repeat protein
MLAYGCPMKSGDYLSCVRSRLLPVLVLVALAVVLAGCKTTALMAPAGDYIYWGDGTTPSIVHKVRTSDLSEVGRITLPTPAATAGALSPDGTIGYAINSNGGAGTITKILLSDMTQLAQAPFGVADANAIVVSPDGSYLYIAADNGTISEVRSSDLVVTRTLTVSGSAFVLHAATISPDGHYAYFGDTTGNVVKVRLADLVVVGTVTMPAAATFISTAVIAPDGLYGYYTAGPSPTSMVKVRLADMTVVSAALLSIDTPSSTVISPDGQYAYVLSNADPAVLLTIRLADLVETRSETTTLDGSSGWSTISPDGQFAYLGDETGTAVRVRLAAATTLVVARAGTGAGTVSSTTPGIDCGSVCTRNYLDYQSVTLTATAGARSTFTGWSGACTGTAPTCTLSMSEARSVTATFSLPDNTFTVGRTRAAISRTGIVLSTTLTVPGGGTLRQSVTGRARARATLCSTKRSVQRAGTYTLVCLLGAKTRTALSRGAVRLTIATTFAPTGGTARTTRRTMILPRMPLAAPRPAPPVTG